MPKIMLAQSIKPTHCLLFLSRKHFKWFEGSLGLFTLGSGGGGGRGVETENPGEIHWYYNLVLNKTCKDNGMYREN